MTFTMGITRAVILIGPYAIKLPNPCYGWKNFLNGLLSNMCERCFSGIAVYRTYTVAKSVWCIPGGWLNVQQRATPLTDEEWSAILDDEFIVSSNLDVKRCNFGTIDGKIVVVDFGEIT